MGAERPATASNSAPAQSAPTTGRAAPTTTAALQWDLDDVTITVERAGEFQEQNNASADLAGRAAPTVHTVVAGDTLWAIAERYLGDPYRYPSLARHSDIRNPHLIRPGDRVVIQRKASQQ